MPREASFTLAALRVAPVPWDTQGNFDKLEHWTRQAVSQGAEVIVTPEGFLEGYVWNDDNPKDFSRQRYREIGQTFDGPLMERIRVLAHELRIHLVVGYAERREDHMYNSVIIYSPEGEIVLRYSKTHTAGDDEPFNTKGAEFPVADTALGRWGALICMDRQLPETSRILAIKGAQIIFVPAWGMHGEINDVVMRARAFENGVYVAFVHPRRCLIVDPSGQVVGQDRGVDDEIVTARISLVADTLSPIRQRRPEIYEELLRTNE